MSLPYNPLAKPQKLTLDERRRRKAEVRAIKAEFHPELYQAPMKANPDEHDRYRVTGSALHTVSREKLKRNKGKVLHSTFTPKPGRRFLNHRRSIQAHIIRSVRTTGYTLKRGKALNLEGVRGRRMKPGDQKARAECHGLPCVCGCSLLVQWAHLETRAYESTRHDPAYSIPACEHLHPWLDQGNGRGCRTELLQMARDMGQRLTHEDVYETLSRNGYYTWLHHERRIL